MSDHELMDLSNPDQRRVCIYCTEDVYPDPEVYREYWTWYYCELCQMPMQGLDPRYPQKCRDKVDAERAKQPQQVLATALSDFSLHDQGPLTDDSDHDMADDDDETAPRKRARTE